MKPAKNLSKASNPVGGTTKNEGAKKTINNLLAGIAELSEAANAAHAEIDDVLADFKSKYQVMLMRDGGLTAKQAKKQIKKAIKRAKH